MFQPNRQKRRKDKKTNKMVGTSIFSANFFLVGTHIFLATMNKISLFEQVIRSTFSLDKNIEQMFRSSFFSQFLLFGWSEKTWLEKKLVEKKVGWKKTWLEKSCLEKVFQPSFILFFWFLVGW